MVLAELGGRISAALQSMTNATVIDEAVLKECLNEIASALLQVRYWTSFFLKVEGNIRLLAVGIMCDPGHRMLQSSFAGDLA